jgi:hypothetical protein
MGNRRPNHGGDRTLAEILRRCSPLLMHGKFFPASSGKLYLVVFGAEYKSALILDTDNVVVAKIDVVHRV